MNSAEATNILEKNIRTALTAIDFPPPPLPRFEEPVVDRTLERIGEDSRLTWLFTDTDDDSMRRTFLSVYYRMLHGTL